MGGCTECMDICVSLKLCAADQQQVNCTYGVLCTVKGQCTADLQCWASCKMLPARNCSQSCPLFCVKAFQVHQACQLCVPCISCAPHVSSLQTSAMVACRLFTLYNTLSVNRVGDSSLRVTSALQGCQSMCMTGPQQN